jgi:hypothetical protein
MLGGIGVDGNECSFLANISGQTYCKRSANAIECSRDILVKVNLHDIIPSLVSAALYGWISTGMLDNNCEEMTTSTGLRTQLGSPGPGAVPSHLTLLREPYLR